MDAVKEYNCAMFARILGYKWAFWKFSSIQTLTNAKDDNKYFPFPSKNLAPPNSKKAVFPSWKIMLSMAPASDTVKSPHSPCKYLRLLMAFVNVWEGVKKSTFAAYF